VELVGALRHATRNSCLYESCGRQIRSEKNIQLETRVVSAKFDDSTSRWDITTNTGDKVNCQFVIMATGSLSTPKKLDIEGIDNFKGDQLHTAYWPEKGYDFAGKRVGSPTAHREAETAKAHRG